MRTINLNGFIYEENVIDKYLSLVKAPDLEEVVIERDIENIQENAFSKNTKSIKFKRNITGFIQEDAFKDLDLDVLEFPVEIYAVERGAFNNCKVKKFIHADALIEDFERDIFSDLTIDTCVVNNYLHESIRCKNFAVSKTSNKFSAENGILYSRSKQELVRYPIFKKEKDLYIKNVEICPGAFCGVNLDNLILEYENVDKKSTRQINIWEFTFEESNIKNLKINNYDLGDYLFFNANIENLSLNKVKHITPFTFTNSNIKNIKVTNCDDALKYENDILYYAPFYNGSKRHGDAIVKVFKDLDKFITHKEQVIYDSAFKDIHIDALYLSEFCKSEGNIFKDSDITNLFLFDNLNISPRLSSLDDIKNLKTIYFKTENTFARFGFDSSGELLNNVLLDKLVIVEKLSHKSKCFNWAKSENINIINKKLEDIGAADFDSFKEFNKFAKIKLNKDELEP